MSAVLPVAGAGNVGCVIIYSGHISYERKCDSDGAQLWRYINYLTLFPGVGTREDEG